LGSVPSLFLEAFLCRKPTIYIHSASSRARNDLLVEHPQTTIVCQYDLSRFAGIDVMKACCSHPGVVYRKRPGLPRLCRRLVAAAFLARLAELAAARDQLIWLRREVSLARFAATAG
jgi:hypothetical protein